jgi:small subunit ribosomal protein S15
MAAMRFANTRLGTPRVCNVSVAPPRVSIVCRSYKNWENIDVSKIKDFMKHENDTGSSNVQVALLSARVQQLTTHLRGNKKDYAARRGLEAILSSRKQLLKYMHRVDRDGYFQIIKDLGLRSVVANDTRGVARKVDLSPTVAAVAGAQ